MHLYWSQGAESKQGYVFILFVNRIMQKVLNWLFLMLGGSLMEEQ